LTILIWVLPLLLSADHSSQHDVQDDIRGCISFLDCKESEYCNREGECVDLNEGYVEPDC
jgi:hypothetical protein